MKSLYQLAEEALELRDKCLNMTGQELVACADQLAREYQAVAGELQELFCPPHPTVTQAREKARKEKKK